MVIGIRSLRQCRIMCLKVIDLLWPGKLSYWGNINRKSLNRTVAIDHRPRNCSRLVFLHLLSADDGTFRMGCNDSKASITLLFPNRIGSLPKFHFISFHFISFHFISFHFVVFHFHPSLNRLSL